MTFAMTKNPRKQLNYKGETTYFPILSKMEEDNVSAWIIIENEKPAIMRLKGFRYLKTNQLVGIKVLSLLIHLH